MILRINIYKKFWKKRIQKCNLNLAIKKSIYFRKWFRLFDFDIYFNSSCSKIKNADAANFHRNFENWSWKYIEYDRRHLKCPIYGWILRYVLLLHRSHDNFNLKIITGIGNQSISVFNALNVNVHNIACSIST